MSVYEKLSKIQANIRVPKEQTNSEGSTIFKYRSCEDILKSLKPFCSENKCLIILSDGIHYIGERYYVSSTASLIDVESGEKVESTAFAREPAISLNMQDPQISGTASSYARKYALNGLLALDDGIDADSMKNNQTEKASETQESSVQPVQVKSMDEALAVKVTKGYCKGLTLKEVLEKKNPQRSIEWICKEDPIACVAAKYVLDAGVISKGENS